MCSQVGVMREGTEGQGELKERTGVNGLLRCLFVLITARLMLNCELYSNDSCPHTRLDWIRGLEQGH